MLKRILPSLLLGVILGWTSSATAEPSTKAENNYKIQVPLGSQRLLAPSALLQARLGEVTMTVSRINSPNVLAWRRKDKDEYLSQVVAGVMAVDGLRLKSQHVGKEGRVPTLDLHFSRKTPTGESLVWMRFLLFRRYTLVATAAVPKANRKHDGIVARNFCRSLKP